MFDSQQIQDVATKAYVDSSINLEVIALALDVTGLEQQVQHNSIQILLQF